MNLKSFPNQEIASKAIFNQILRQLKNNVNNKPISIGLSGGTSPIPLIKLLSNFLKENPLYINSLFFGWVDERMVPYTNSRSNFGTAMKYFNFFENTSTFFPLPIVNTLNKFTKTNVAKNFYGAPFFVKNAFHFDILILGMGEDGHTASVFPSNKPLKVLDDLEYIKHPSINEHRITLSLKTINRCNNKFFIIFGDSKKSMLINAIKCNSSLPTSQVIDSNTTIYTDIYL